MWGKQLELYSPCETSCNLNGDIREKKDQRYRMDTFWAQIGDERNKRLRGHKVIFSRAGSYVLEDR